MVKFPALYTLRCNQRSCFGLESKGVETSSREDAGQKSDPAVQLDCLGRTYAQEQARTLAGCYVHFSQEFVLQKYLEM